MPHCLFYNADSLQTCAQSNPFAVCSIASGGSPGIAVTIQLHALAVQRLRPIRLGVLKYRHVQKGAPVHGHNTPLKITAYTSHTQWPISLAMKIDKCV